MTRGFAFVALAAAALAAAAFWWWLGRSVPVPDAPAGKVACLSYSPYRSGQTPFDAAFVVPATQIAEDLPLLAPFTRCVRSYGVDQGLDAIVPAARAAGLQVMLGAWLGRDAAHNAREIARAIELANAYPDTVRAIVIGNEVLLRGELGAAEIAALLRAAQSRTQVPITYADVWEFWTRHAAVLADAVDFVTIHILPYWEDEPVAIDQALAHVEAVLRRVEAAIPGKHVMIGEAGWPSAGRMRDGALPTRVNAARFLRGFTALAEARGLDYNLIEAFDQPWKRALEGTVGGHWGLFTADREPKFALTGPVSDWPHWRRACAAAALIGAMPVIWAVLRRREPDPWGWIALAFAGQAAGSILVLQADHAVLATRTAPGAMIAGAGVLLSAATAWLLLDALARRAPATARMAPIRTVVPALRRPWAAAPTRAMLLGALRLAAAGAALATSLGLVFDPRYRDFPIAAFLLPAVGFALAFLANARDERPGTEEAWVAALLAVSAVVIAGREGPRNYQALAWAAICLLLALPWLIAWLRGRRSVTA